MAYKVKTPAPCVECGNPTKRRLRETRVACCFECAIERNQRRVTELHLKQGKAHDTWVASMVRFLARALPSPEPAPPVRTDGWEKIQTGQWQSIIPLP